MDPRRIALNRRHSREMSLLFTTFLETHPHIEWELAGDPMTAADDAAWTAYSANLLRRHQAERSALATQLEAERRQRDRG